MTDSSDPGRSHWITDVASDHAREWAEAKGYDPDRIRWEMFVEARHGYPALVMLLDYALAMCLWTASEEARGTGETNVIVAYRTVYLVGLALYVAAEREDIHDLSFVDMRSTVELLDTDAHARKIALTEPGDEDPKSHFREDTRRELDMLLAPEHVVEWERIRDSAHRVVKTNAECLPGKAFLYPRNSQIAAYGIRRHWYLAPHLSPIMSSSTGEGPARR